MIKTKKIKAILFDSGHTLNYPRMGNWFIPPNFQKHINPIAMQLISPSSLENAIEIGICYLLENHSVSSEAEEFAVFKEFYQIVADSLHMDKNDINISNLAYDSVYNDDKFVFYDDVPQILQELSKRYKLGIVSDTWPSLERVFINAGFRKYFSSFIISSKLGVRKPDGKMYKAALEELCIQPDEALFVDDSVVNIEGARLLGIAGVHIIRGDTKCEGTACLHVKNLNELADMLK